MKRESWISQNCSYCLVKELERRARAEKKKLTLVESSYDGIDFYLHPRNVKIPNDFIPYEDDSKLCETLSGYWECWLKVVPKKCECKNRGK